MVDETSAIRIQSPDERQREREANESCGGLEEQWLVENCFLDQRQGLLCVQEEEQGKNGGNGGNCINPRFIYHTAEAAREAQMHESTRQVSRRTTGAGGTSSVDPFDLQWRGGEGM